MLDSVIWNLNTVLHLQLPIIRNTALFRSFYGQYNDNPKYISEELHRRFPDMRIIWTIRDGKKEDFPDYVELVELNSPAYQKYAARAEIVIDNYFGCRSAVVENGNILKKAYMKYRSKARKGQFRLSTWHGTPLKHIALDEPRYQKMKGAAIYTSTDVMLAGEMITVNAYRTALRWKNEIAMYGMPRNDILFSDDADLKIRMKKKLGLPLDKKVVLFAPTFRNSVEMSGLYQLRELDINRLCGALGEKFGGEWCFVFRSHNEVMNEVAKHGALSDNIINGNRFPDMAEYLVACDVLISDYSGCLFDNALTKMPCFLYTPDLEYYRGTERGFYLDICTLPFSISVTAAELIDNICSFDQDKYREAVEAMLADIGSIDDGNASRRAVDRVADFLAAR